MSKATIVEYFGKQSEYRCGYCKSSDTNYSHGMWGHTLTPQDYQSLINRGWRRSGKYLYKPTNNLACCPAYTINCHALEFQLSKSQKKVLRRFNRFLLEDGTKNPVESKMNKSTKKGDSDTGELTDGGENITSFAPQDGKIPSNININHDKMDVSETKGINSKNFTQENKEKSVTAAKVSNFHPTTDLKSHSNDSLADFSKQENNVVRSNFKKAKQFRIERKKQKLIQKGVDPSAVTISKKQCEPKSLEDFFTPSVEAKKKFSVKTVRVGTLEFEETFDVEHRLYRMYQMTIHQDQESDCTAKQFRRFLCDSPLIKTGRAEDEMYGTYHQQYFIDEEMIAVGVIDILPDCVSSVYFFYSPNYMFLTLGTFGALREVAYVRELRSLHPSIRYYYMGFYIHSCVKMRYKGCFSPSYLLCPEEYTWHLLTPSVRDILSASKYSRLNESLKKTSTDVNVNNVRVLFRGHRMLYETFKSFELKNDTDEVQEYANLVGEACSQSIMLYRSHDDD